MISIEGTVASAVNPAPTERRTQKGIDHGDRNHPPPPRAPCASGTHLSGVLRCRRTGQVAAAIRLHLQGAPLGRQSWRHLQDVVHELHDGQWPLLWRRDVNVAIRNDPLNPFDDRTCRGDTVTVALKCVVRKLKVVQKVCLSHSGEVFISAASRRQLALLVSPVPD